MFIPLFISELKFHARTQIMKSKNNITCKLKNQIRKGKVFTTFAGPSGELETSTGNLKTSSTCES
jgi:hypothetical protein